MMQTEHVVALAFHLILLGMGIAVWVHRDCPIARFDADSMALLVMQWKSLRFSE
jgi:hypothetical protein